jgi:hypothetical protein
MAETWSQCACVASRSLVSEKWKPSAAIFARIWAAEPARPVLMRMLPAGVTMR